MMGIFLWAARFWIGINHECWGMVDTFGQRGGGIVIVQALPWELQDLGKSLATFTKA